MTSLLLPVGPRANMSSWTAHINRGEPSSEPGTDFYCPHGTEVVAPDDGVIYATGNSVIPATGRYVGIAMDNGMATRGLHFSRLIRTSGRVKRGEVIALSGASGYGSEFFGEPERNAAFYRNTGGDHVHQTLWPTHTIRYGYKSNGVPWTIDIMDYVGGSAAGGITPTKKEDEDMDFINVQGKTGVHRGGQFAIYRGNADGKLYARRITFDTMNPAFPTIDNEGLENLKKAMPFIDLV